MKQDAANHWKIRELGRRLTARLAEGNLGGGFLPQELQRRLAMGVIESLWIWCKRYYPRGDIGRAPDEIIASECGWDVSDSRWFVDALCQCRLIDASKKYRLILHDLSEHAEDYVRKSLERAGITTFADGKPVRRNEVGRPPKAPRTKPPEKLAAVATASKEGINRKPPSPSLPNPSYPFQTQEEKTPLPPVDVGRVLWTEIQPLHAAYPPHRRGGQGGFMRAVEPVVARLRAQGLADPIALLLLRVQAYASSWLAKNEGGLAIVGPDRFFGEGVWEQDPADWGDPAKPRPASPEDQERRTKAAKERERREEEQRAAERRRILAVHGRQA